MTHYGKQQGRLVPCKRSQDHGFHPECEACDWCAADSKPEPSAKEPVGDWRHYYGYDLFI